MNTLSASNDPALLKMVIDLLPAEVFLIDKNFRLVLANARVLQLCDLSFQPQDIYCFHVLHGRSEPCSDCPACQVWLTGKEAQSIHVHQDLRGLPKYVEVSAYPVNSVDGGSEQVLVVSSEVTDIKALEGKILKADQSLRRRTEIMEGISKIRRKGLTRTTVRELSADAVNIVRALFASDRVSLILFRDQGRYATIAAVDPEGISLPKQGQSFRVPKNQDLGRLYATGKAVYQPDRARAKKLFELDRLVIKEGLRSVYLMPLKAEGEVVGALVLGNSIPYGLSKEDISLADQVAEAIAMAIYNCQLYLRLQNEKHKSEAIIENIHDGITIIDTNLKIIYANQLAHALFGQDLVGNFCHQAFVREPVPCQDCPTQKAFESGQPQRTIRSGRDKENHPVEVEVTATPIRDEAGNFAYCVEVIRDVSEQQALARMKDEFISTASHELRTPLAIVKGFAQLLLRKEQLKIDREHEARLLVQIDEEIERLNKLVEALLDASRIEAEGVGSHVQPFTLKEVVSSAIDSLRSKAVPRNLQMISNIDEFDLVVLADAVHIEQILVNLLSNAIKYSMDNNSIEVKVETKDEMALISVRDEGVGIPSGQQGKLFKKFSRIPNLRSSLEGGTGLGLYITKGLVEAQGGSIWLESVECQGSTFYFTIPLAGNREKKMQMDMMEIPIKS